MHNTFDPTTQSSPKGQSIPRIILVLSNYYNYAMLDIHELQKFVGKTLIRHKFNK